MIKIGYFGDGPWASRALSQLAAEPSHFAIGFITPRFDTQDPALKEWAQKLGVPFLPCENVNDEAFIEKIASYGCDILVSMSFNQILRANIIAAAPLGFINCHAGALPFYRGRNPLNWALINGETEFGVTVHYVDEGIDTGDIILQHQVAIAPDDTYAALLEKAHGACAETLLQALLDISMGQVRVLPQADIHPVGFYCGRRREGDEWIDWQDSAQAIYDFIRALDVPGPGARTLSENGAFAILKARMIAGAPSYKACCGEVVGRTEEGVIVKTGDSTILVMQAAALDEKGALSTPFTPRWRIGTRLGLDPLREIHRLHQTVSALQKEMERLREDVRLLQGTAEKGRKAL